MFRGPYYIPPPGMRVVPPGADPFDDEEFREAVEPIEPPSPGASQHGQTRDVQAGEATSVLRWRSHDRGVEQVSLHLGLVIKGSLTNQDGTPGGQPTPVVQAELRWGIGGATHTALVDYMQGTSIALAASEVEVIARSVRDGSLGAQVTASLARNIKPSNNVPSALLTVHIDAVGGEVGAVQTLVPPWATVGIVTFAPAGATFLLTGFDAGLGPVDGLLWEQLVQRNGETFPVVSRQTGVLVTPDGASDVERVSLQYALVF